MNQYETDTKVIEDKKLSFETDFSYDIEPMNNITTCSVFYQINKLHI